jgi:hypothetical protein
MCCLRAACRNLRRLSRACRDRANCNRVNKLPTPRSESAVGHGKMNSAQSFLIRSTSVSGIYFRSQTLPGRANFGLMHRTKKASARSPRSQRRVTSVEFRCPAFVPFELPVLVTGPSSW